MWLRADADSLMPEPGSVFDAARRCRSAACVHADNPVGLGLCYAVRSVSALISWSWSIGLPPKLEPAVPTIPVPFSLIKLNPISAAVNSLNLYFFGNSLPEEWCRRQDSNLRPADYETAALTT